MLDRTEPPRLICVAPFMVAAIWPRVCSHVDKAYMAIDSHIPIDLFNRLLIGDALLWIVVDASDEIIYVFITELHLRRSGIKVCRLVAGAGERMSEWLPLQERLEQYARDEGCDKIVAEGRVGWVRALTGYTEIRRVIEKDL